MAEEENKEEEAGQEKKKSNMMMIVITSSMQQSYTQIVWREHHQPINNGQTMMNMPVFNERQELLDYREKDQIIFGDRGSTSILSDPILEIASICNTAITSSSPPLWCSFIALEAH